MQFPTLTFALFFTAVLCISWLLRPRYLLWRVFIVGASWIFYGYWDARFVALLAASTAGNYLVGLAIYRSRQTAAPPLAAVAVHGSVALKERDEAPVPSPGWPRRTRWLLGLGIALNLGVLAWFKYWQFFTESLVNTLSGIGVGAPLPLVQIVLPIGISFFTFHAISYLVDIGRGQIRPMRPLDFAAYFSLFPHLIAGPIVRASELAPQLERPADAASVQASRAFSLIMLGLFKKVVISSYLASAIVDPVFGVPAQHSAPEVLVAIYAYAVQIFADFSGYTDIAIGCALLLGFEFPQNFNAPYASTSLRDFWRRWHMTLCRWLRDYLYIPLGGSRGGKLFTARNLLITMVLGGLWHGAAWTFVVWGAIHGGGLVIERFLTKDSAPSGRFAAVRWFITFNVVCLAWVFFRASSVSAAVVLLGRLTAWDAAPLVTPLLIAVVAGSIASQFVPLRLRDGLLATFSRLEPMAQATALALGLVLINVLGPEGVAPFIYFQF